MLMQQAMSGQMQNNPQMSLFNQMMQGKNPAQQMQTLLNSAQSKGIDINAKIFSEEDVRALGIIK